MRLETQVMHLSGNLAADTVFQKPVLQTDYEVEINQRAGKVIELLSEMVSLANLIRQGKNPSIKYGPFIYAAILSEFRNSARGQRLIKRNPEILPRLYESYKIFLDYSLGK